MDYQNENGNDVLLGIIVAIVVAVSAIKDYDAHTDLSPAARARKLLYGMVGSGLTTWTMYELLMYFALPSRLCLALAGACGYLGAEVVTRLLISFVEKKIQTKA